MIFIRQLFYLTALVVAATLSQAAWPAQTIVQKGLGRQSAPTGFQPGAPWPKFHADNSNSGVGGGSGADGLIKWGFATGSQVVSSPAIAADGTIYIGSLDGKLYAINPNGTKKWAF